MDKNNYNTRLDKKAFLILFLYIWIAVITVVLNKDNLKESYTKFAKKIIVPNIIMGYNIIEDTIDTNYTNQTKENNDYNQTRKISTSK